MEFHPLTSEEGRGIVLPKFLEPIGAMMGTAPPRGGDDREGEPRLEAPSVAGEVPPPRSVRRKVDPLGSSLRCRGGVTPFERLRVGVSRK